MTTDMRKIECRAKLVGGCTVSRQDHLYTELGKHIGLPPMSAGKYLDDIYREEIGAGRPGLTLVVVRADSRYGPYFSQGAEAKKVKFDPKNAKQRDEYDQALIGVYDFNW